MRDGNGGNNNSSHDKEHATMPEPQEMVCRGGEDRGRNGMGKDTENSAKKVQATAVPPQQTHTVRRQEAKANVKELHSLSVIDAVVDATHQCGGE